MKTILVSGASGIVGYGILKCLKNSGCRLIGTTIYANSPAECFADSVEIVPQTSDDRYLPCLIQLIKKYNVDMIIPGIEADMSCWNKNRDILTDTGTFLLLNTKELIDACLDKWSFYKAMKAHGLEYCIESSIDANFKTFHLPFIIKPRCGYGSKGIVKVDSAETFEKYRERIGTSLMMQEYVGDDDAEYTVSAFFDADGMMRALSMLKRKLSDNGFTEWARSIETSEIEHVILQLAAVFHPLGPTNFQFRKKGNSWKLLEINPRISSSTSIRNAFGYNESQMSIDYFLYNREVCQPVIKKGEVIRYIEDYMLYDSDHI